MRIAVYHNLPTGGAKRALFETVRRLAPSHQVDVYTLSTASQAFGDVRPWVAGHRVFAFRPLPECPRPFGLLNHGARAADIVRLRRLHRAIAREIDGGGYDVALVHGDQHTQSPLVLQFLRTPSVYCCQDVLRKVYDPPIARPYARLTGLRRWADRLNALRVLYTAAVTRADQASLRASSLVLVNSCFSMETVYRLYAVRTRVCPLGVDTELFRPLGLEREGYAISVGSVTPPKGFDFVVRSLGLVPASRRPPLLIVGNYVSPAERRYLEELAERTEVRVEIRSLVSDAELVTLYNRACLTLYAPALEPFGLVPLESMACGTPVIGVAEAGVRETVRDGETGLLTEREPTQFAAAVMSLLSTPTLRDDLGRRGPGYVRQHWPWDESVRQLESYLAMAVGKVSAEAALS